MRHEITHPLDRFQSSITSRRCGATGTRSLLLHPAIVAGETAELLLLWPPPALLLLFRA
ncbi:unnamed protein product [Ectocarpus sp. 12 AP-2014]